MPGGHVCPNCATVGMEIFFAVEAVPVHSVQLLRTYEEALQFPTGDIELAFCKTCGFISNVAFEPDRHDYSREYESTQQFSSVFNEFHRRLADDLVDRYDLHSKNLVEIGCGQGEFLSLLCDVGGNTGVGFDPAFVAGRNPAIDGKRVRIIKDYFSEECADGSDDFYCCKMTLEHIFDTQKFVATVRRVLGDQHDAIVFFQVPDARPILRNLGFWDIYYEHCSYFSPPSLSYVFQAAGFNVLDLKTEYDNQYLTIEARPRNGTVTALSDRQEELEHLTRDVSYFTENLHNKMEGWRQKLRDMKRRGKRTVIWGGGSKCVAFLTMLGVDEEIACVVDINPLKHGTYIAGTGHDVNGPETLRQIEPDCVIMMNPIYRSEIGRRLGEMGIEAELIAP